MSDERGVSDVIGFTLVFGLIITSVALVSVTAFTSIQEARESQQRQNSLRAFAVFDDNIEEVANNQNSARTTELRVTNAQLYFGDTREITIIYSEDAFSSGTSSNNRFLLNSRETTPIVYQSSSDQRILYTAGAIISESGDGAVMYEAPPIYRTNDSPKSPIYLSLLTLSPRSDSLRGVGGGTRVLYAQETGPPPSEDTSTQPSRSPNGELRITINNTTATGAWERWCQGEEFDADSISTTDDSVTCTTDATDYFAHYSNISTSIS